MIKLIKLSYPKHIDLVPNEMEHIQSSSAHQEIIERRERQLFR